MGVCMIYGTTRNMELILLLLSVVGSTCIIAECPDKWLSFEQKCYFIGTHPVGWFTAKAMCNAAEGSHLAEILTKSENDFVKGIATKLHSDLWLGGRDVESEGHWNWDFSLSKLNFTDWGPYQPDNKGGENCLHLAHGFNYRWNDANCEITKKYVCELRNKAGPLVPIIG